jgi:hypothetical protein
MNQPKTIFEFLSAMTDQKAELNFSNSDISSKYDMFMLNRWLSMVDVFLPVVAEINKYNVSNETHYNYFKALLPKKKVFINYIKKNKELNWEERKLIARHYKTNLKNVDDIVKILSENELKSVIKLEREKDGT